MPCHIHRNNIRVNDFTQMIDGDVMKKKTKNLSRL